MEAMWNVESLVVKDIDNMSDINITLEVIRETKTQIITKPLHSFNITPVNSKEIKNKYIVWNKFSGRRHFPSPLTSYRIIRGITKEGKTIAINSNDPKVKPFDYCYN